MEKVKIDKGIPMPFAVAGESIYPFRDMKVGDSVLYRGTAKNIGGVGAMIVGWARRSNDGRKFAVRTMPDGTRRIWRVK